MSSEEDTEEYNLLTLEDFKNEISNKNDKIKNQHEMWWISLKSDLLYYAQYVFMDDSADLVNILLVYLAKNLVGTEINILQGVGIFDDINDILLALNDSSIKLKRISKKDILEFLTILIKYVKSTSGYESDYVEKFSRNYIDGEEVGLDQSDIEEIKRSINRNDMKNIYVNYFVDSVKLIEHFIATNYSRAFGDLEDKLIKCGDKRLFHPLEKYFEVFDDVEDYKLDAAINAEKYNRNKERITNMTGIIGKSPYDNSRTRGEKKQLEEENKLIEPVLESKQEIKEEYESVEELIYKKYFNTKFWSGKRQHLKTINKKTLINDMEKINDMLENIIIGRIFVTYWDSSAEKEIDKCLAKEVFLYTLLLQGFISSNYDNLKDYYDDIDGRKAKELANIDDYDFVDIVICIDKYIQKLKKYLESDNRTRLKYLYQPGEKVLVEDSDEEYENLEKEKEKIDETLGILKKGLYEVPDDYFKKGDYVVFRETLSSELVDYNDLWHPTIKDLSEEVRTIISTRQAWSGYQSSSSDEEYDTRDRPSFAADDYGGGSRGGMEGTGDEQEPLDGLSQLNAAITEARAALLYDPSVNNREPEPAPESNEDESLMNRSYYNRITRMDNEPNNIINYNVPQKNYLREDYIGESDSDSDSDSELSINNISDDEDYDESMEIDYEKAVIEWKDAFGIGKIISIKTHIRTTTTFSYEIKYAVIRIKMPGFGGSYKYRNLVKPLSTIKKTLDLMHLDKKEKRVKFGDWMNDKILIDDYRFMNSSRLSTFTRPDIYQFDNLYPWPNGESEDKLNPFYNPISDYMNAWSPGTKTSESDEDPDTLVISKATILETVRIVAETYSVDYNKSGNYLEDGLLVPFLYSVITKINYEIEKARKSGMETYMEELVKLIKFVKNMTNTYRYNPRETLIDLFVTKSRYYTTPINKDLPELTSQPREGAYYDVSIDKFTVPGEGIIIDILTPSEETGNYNNLAYSIAYIKCYDEETDSHFIVQRLLRNLSYDYSSSEITKKDLELKKIGDIMDEYDDANIEAYTSLYISNPYRKNKDIYNQKLKELGMGDIQDRIERSKTKVKDKDIKMLELAAQKAKVLKPLDEQDISLAPEYLKWMKHIKDMESKDFTFDIVDKDLNYGLYKDGYPGDGAEEFKEFDEDTDEIEQPDEVELEYLDSLGIDKATALKNPSLVIDKSLKSYDLRRGPEFRGVQDLRNQILSNRVNSDESSESRRRTNRMNRLVNTIDREREIRRQNIESYSMSQMRGNDEAATRIQAAYRGNRTRRNPQENTL
jgi:hypothetical protein